MWKATVPIRDRDENLYNRQFAIWYGGGNRNGSNRRIIRRDPGDKKFHHRLEVAIIAPLRDGV